MKLSFRKLSLRFILRIFFAALFLIPLVWIMMASLRPQGTPLSASFGFTDGISLQNFSRMWNLVPMGKYTWNSLLVVGLALPLTLITSSWAGFSISQLSLRSQRRWVLLSLAVLMVPSIALWSSRFILYKALGWHNTIWALIAPAWMGTSPFYILMFYRAFKRIPSEIYASARLDGAGVLTIWWQIALPLVRPTAIGVGILSFIVYWGDFISPLLYLQSEEKYTLAIALQLLEQMGRSDWSLLMSAALYMSAIPIILFLFVQPFLNTSD